MPTQYRSLDRHAAYNDVLIQRKEEAINNLRREKSEVIKQAVKRSTLPLQLTTATTL